MLLFPSVYFPEYLVVRADKTTAQFNIHRKLTLPTILFPDLENSVQTKEDHFFDKYIIDSYSHWLHTLIKTLRDISHEVLSLFFHKYLRNLKMNVSAAQWRPADSVILARSEVWFVNFTHLLSDNISRLYHHCMSAIVN